MKITLATLVLIVFVVTATFSQKSVSSIMAQYAVSFPMAGTNDFVNKISLRGLMLDYRYHPSPEIAIGFSSGLLTFYDQKKHHMDNPDGGSSISGTQYRYLNSVPFLFVADYYSHAEELLSRFVGIGVGTTYNRADEKMAHFHARTNAWQFTVAPEAGFRFGYDFGLSAYLSVRYTNSFGTRSVSNQSYVSLNIGLMRR
jgi:hypothetical protein